LTAPPVDGRGFYQADDKLAKWAETARAEGRRVRVAVRVRIPYEEILDLATDELADLVAIGTQGRRGIPHALLGSVAVGAPLGGPGGHRSSSARCGPSSRTRSDLAVPRRAGRQCPTGGRASHSPA